MLLVARSSDRRGERVWHTAIPLLVAASGFVIASVAQNHFVAIGGTGHAVVFGLVGTYGPYYSLASSFFSRARGARRHRAGQPDVHRSWAASWGPISSACLSRATGGYAAGMLALAAGLVISVGILLLLGRVMAARRAVIA